MSWAGRNMAEWCDVHRCDQGECKPIHDEQEQIEFIANLQLEVGLLRDALLDAKGDAFAANLMREFHNGSPAGRLVKGRKA